jgi:AmmeMemoRadiSam system protein A
VTTSLPLAQSAMFSDGARSLLTAIAWKSIDHGLAHGCAPTPADNGWPGIVREHRSCFVTLTLDRELRGCIGSLTASRPLAEDVAANAWSAAFRDPRFPPLNAEERVRVDLSLSVLSNPEALPCRSEQELLDRLVPGVDGLTLIDGRRRGTFLPAVWESLPDRRDFLARLKCKAGLPPEYWSETLRFERYTAESW